MKFSRVYVFRAVVVLTAVLGCKGGGSGGTQTSQGFCSNACLKDCANDNDCDVVQGELCCNFGADGKACMPASQCPRFCTADQMCDVTASEACVQPLPDTSKICALPSQGLRSCSMDTQCMTGEKCCGIYGQSYCLPSLLCPVSCSDASGCNTGQGEICCTAVAAADPALAVPGLCLHPDEFTCPRTCTQSSQCQTQNGEICCEGICSTACAKACDTSNDCSGQICCKSKVLRSSWFTTRSLGYPVHVSTSGAGGVSGSAGTFGTAGTNGRGGTTGTAGTFGTGGTGGGVVAGNLIKNGDFSLGAQYWNPQIQVGASGYITADQGAMCVVNTSYTTYLSFSLGYPFSVADAFSVQAGGIYTLRFRAATLYFSTPFEAKIGLAVSPYTALYSVTGTVSNSTTSYQTFTYAPTFTANTSTVGFVINGTMAPYNATCFDDVVLIRN